MSIQAAFSNTSIPYFSTAIRIFAFPFPPLIFSTARFLITFPRDKHVRSCVSEEALGRGFREKQQLVALGKKIESTTGEGRGEDGRGVQCTNVN
jgi:hypothetical protein